MILGRHRLSLFDAAEQLFRIAGLHRGGIRSQNLFIESRGFLLIALRLLRKTCLAQVHRGRQVVVGGLHGLLVELHRPGVVLLLNGDIALQTVVLCVDQLPGDTFQLRELRQVFGGVLQIARTQVADARIMLGEVARRRRAVLR